MYYGLPPEERLPPAGPTEIAPMIRPDESQQPKHQFLTLVAESPEQAVVHDTPHNVPEVSVREPTPDIPESQPQQQQYQHQQQQYRYQPPHAEQSQPSQPHYEPKKRIEQPRQEFSAPSMEWDATR
jgi:hypothetical protein